MPEKAGDVERFAAAELVQYVEAMSGARLPVHEAAVTGALSVHVGLREQLAVDGLPDPRDGFDGYVLHVDQTRVVVAGDNPRGVLYGVYDLLERLGCRWYYPAIDPDDPEIVPSERTVELPPLAVAEASPFKYRVCHPSSMIYKLNVPDALAHVDWAAKARYNVMLFYFTERATYESAGTMSTSEAAAMVPAQAMEEAAPQGAATASAPRLPTPEDLWAGTAEYESSGVVGAIQQRGMLLEGPNHCFLFFLSNELFDTKPEWFGMVDGVRVPQGALRPEFCWSNAEAVEHFTDEGLRWLLDHPFINVCNFIPNDGGKACACPSCAVSTPTDLYAALCNRMMAKIDAAGLDVEMEILGGYNPVMEPPTGVRLDPRIRVHWAHWGRPFHEWYGDPDYALRENLDTWLASGQPFTMVEYLTDTFAGPAIIPPAAQTMDRDTKWLIEQKAAGNLSLMYPHASWWNAGLNGWLAASWYFQDRSAVDLMDDYSLGYFGAAGPAMKDVHRLLAAEMWLTYWALGPRWSEPKWARVDEAERAQPLLDVLATLLDEAEAAATDPINVYRLSRPLAAWRVLVLAGRARLVTTPLVHEFAAAAGGGGGDLRRRMEAAREHEESVVQPAVAALLDHKGLLPTGFESDKLLQRANTDDLAAAIATLL